MNAYSLFVLFFFHWIKSISMVHKRQCRLRTSRNCYLILEEFLFCHFLFRTLYFNIHLTQKIFAFFRTSLYPRCWVTNPILSPLFPTSSISHPHVSPSSKSPKTRPRILPSPRPLPTVRHTHVDGKNVRDKAAT